MQAEHSKFTFQQSLEIKYSHVMQWNIPVKSQPNPSDPTQVLGCFQVKTAKLSVVIQKCSMKFLG